MGAKEINIGNKNYYFCDDVVDVKNFHSNLLKIDKKLHENIDMYYIGYIYISVKFTDRENIHIVNPLYLINHSATVHLKEKDGEKYLIIDSTEEYEEYIMVERNCFMKKNIQELELIQMMIYL